MVPKIPSCCCMLLTDCFPFKFTESISTSVMVTKSFFLINRIINNHEIIMSSASTLIRHQIFEGESMSFLTRSSLKFAIAPPPQNTLFIIVFMSQFKF